MAKRGVQSEVTFRCEDCRQGWKGQPQRTEDAPEDDWHPWRYFAACPRCGEEAGQDKRERGLFKAWALATGPRTEAGKERSAANLAGHPTPEEAQRTRFNAVTHGLYARVATYYPARPGGYAECEGCRWMLNGCGTVHTACQSKTELYLRHHLAFTARDPGLLTELRAEEQAGVAALLSSMIRAVARRGVEIVSPEWYQDKDGMPHAVQVFDENGNLRTIEKISAHPLLKPIGEFLSRNSLTLADQGMTPKVREEEDLVKGHLTATEDAQQALSYQAQQVRLLDQLRAQIDRSRERTARDPVLIEHQRSEQDGEGDG